MARNCDQFIALFAFVVIGRSNYFGIWFFESHLKTALIFVISCGCATVSAGISLVPIKFFSAKVKCYYKSRS